MDRATAAALVAAAAAQRRQRRQRRRAWLMSGFAVLTLAAMTAVAQMVVVLDRLPGTAASLSADTTVPAAPARLVDRATGLSYVLLGSPWNKGCPAALSAGGLRWTDGESTVAGIVSGGRVSYANACSGVLPRALWGASPSQAASKVMNSVYTAGLRSTRAMLSDAATRIGGKPAWMVVYVVRYPGQHLGWTSSLGAVVIAGRTMFYVSVPSSLGSGNALTVLNSLQ